MEETVLEQIVRSTGLPEDLVEKKLNRWILQKGVSPKGMGLDELREVMVSLLQEIFVEIKEGSDSSLQIESSK